MSDQTARQRIRQLLRKLTSSPTLPLLGWTKTVETIVATGPTMRWTHYSTVVTAIWVYAYELSAAADNVADAAEDAVEEATDS